MQTQTTQSTETLDDFVIFRPMVADDAAFIFDSWLKSYRDSEFAMRVRGPLYRAQQHDLIEKLLRRGHGVVAADAEEPWHIVGYVAGEAFGALTCIHYLYVKQNFRRKGIARKLYDFASLGASAVQHSHDTDDGRKVAKRLGSVFNPYLMF